MALESPNMRTTRFTIVIPVFNDWPTLSELLPRLHHVLAAAELQVDLLIVDDGSTQPPVLSLDTAASPAFLSIDVLTLRRNLGHQRAIACGLAHLSEQRPHQPVLVMDADGEDRPEDVPLLVERLDREDGQMIVFAERLRREESIVFKSFYVLYRMLHYALTGVKVRVGNFSVVPPQLLERLVGASELWSHYVAAVFKARLPCCNVPTPRGARIVGRSHMNIVALIIHGLSSMSVYADVVAVRVLLPSFGLLVLVGGLVAWHGATLPLLVLLMVLFQAFTSCCLLAFVDLRTRQNLTFIPLRDYRFFVLKVQHWTPSTR